MKLAVFDLGGTVVEDAGHVPAAFATALETHGFSVSAEELSRWRGASKREVVRRIAGDGEASERVYRSFQESLIDLLSEHGSRPIAGIERAFEQVRSAGLQIAITTGFDRRVTEVVLQSLEHREILNAVVCGDDVSSGRPAPFMIFRAMELTGVASVHEVANIGDTTNDLLAGFHAGVAASIGVLTGAHPRELLSEVPHTHILGSAAHVPEVVLADVAPVP